MSQNWQNLLFEIALLTILGILYYFYQKKKILKADENRIPFILEFVLQACLAEKKEEEEAELMRLIEEIDDFLQNKTSLLPIQSMKTYKESKSCGEDLKDVIHEALIEIEQIHGKK